MSISRTFRLLSVILLIATNTTFSAERPFPSHWGEPPAIQTRDIRELPAGYGQGSSTMANWIQQNLDKDASSKDTALTISARDFIDGAQGYYLDHGKWLAIHPDKAKEASAQTAFPFPSGNFDVTLYVVGESDGQSTFQLSINDTKLGDFIAPLSEKTFEEGARFSTIWRGITISSGDVLKVSSQIASNDGKEWSRARVARIEFAAADEATKKEVGKFLANKPAKPSAPESPSVPLILPRGENGTGAVDVSGELKEWHKVTLTLDGPFAHELDHEPNPFMDYDLTVTFTHESGEPSYRVPGYFAADGNAGQSSAESGTKWRAHLSPDKAGSWSYSVSFTRGKDAALDGGGEVVKPFDAISGTFSILPTDKTGRDFRAHGRLQYVGKHHLQFAASKEYFLKAGPDSPETLLAYADFDNTETLKKNVPVKTWEAHQRDWRPGDPTWKDGKGKGLIGALNYLSSAGVNAFSFLTYNTGGDGSNVWPFVRPNEKLHWDCSKLDQWCVVFDHATAKGLYLHFKLQENEIDDNRRGEKSETGKEVPESLDGGSLGPQRKLYCREIIARFAHELALNWNIGEENTQDPEEINAMIDYIHAMDPYKHPVVIHTFPPQQEKVYLPLLGAKSKLAGVSLQNSWNAVNQRTRKWVNESAASGRPWVVANDEQGGADTGVPPDMGYEGYDGKKKDGGVVQTTDDIRQATLWGNLMAGGAGVEYYFGYQLPENDLVCQDWRSRAKSWDYCRIALDFFRAEKIPFWEMTSSNALVGNSKDDNSKYCLAKKGELYLVYLPKGGAAELDLSDISGEFKISWFDPRQGGPLKDGGKTVNGGSKVLLDAPDAQDWLAVVLKN